MRPRDRANAMRTQADRILELETEARANHDTADREHVRANRAEDRAERVEHALSRVLNAFGVVPTYMMSTDMSEAMQAARLELYLIHRHDPPTILTDTMASALAGQRVERVLTNDEAERLKAEWAAARIDIGAHPPVPPPPPPPHHTEAGYELIDSRALKRLRDERDQARGRVGELERQRAQQEQRRLYRARVKCVAVHTNAHGAGLDIETWDRTDSARVTLTRAELRARGNIAELLAAPLTLTLEELDPPPPAAPPPETDPVVRVAREILEDADRFFGPSHG